MAPVAEGLLRRPRVITLSGLGLLAALAWAWLAAGAGMGTASMTAWDAPRVLLTLSMWWVMMVAMMLPSAAPVILLYGHARRRRGTAAATGAFLGGYLIVWAGFSMVATALQLLLERAGLAVAMTMGPASPLLSGGLLIATGLYQLSELKRACLTHCRNPGEFIARHHRAGALRMGMIHGAWCVGCCWALMLLLFVGGVMNLVWIAALALIVAAEKLLPFGQWVPRITAPLLIAWGFVSLLPG